MTGILSPAGNTHHDIPLPRICYVQQSCRHMPALCNICSAADIRRRGARGSRNTELRILMKDRIVLAEGVVSTGHVFRMFTPLAEKMGCFKLSENVNCGNEQKRR